MTPEWSLHWEGRESESHPWYVKGPEFLGIGLAWWFATPQMALACWNYWLELMPSAAFSTNAKAATRDLAEKGGE